MSSTQSVNPLAKASFKTFLLWLAIVLAIFFYRSFFPGWVQNSNDGPLGALNAAWMNPWHTLTGQWMDIYWLGRYTGSLPIDLNSLLSLLGPVGYSKFMPPLTVLFLGACAWVFFRQLKLPRALCVVASLAAALNMNFFSNICWGLGTRGLTLGWIFLALAALLSAGPRGNWLKIIAAGFAVGMAVVEGADNGAIFSLYVGAFALYMAFAEDKPAPKTILNAAARVALVAVAAGLISAHAIFSLVGTQIKGVAIEKESESSEARWNFATQWSLPKVEGLRVLIPGLFGYRMDTPEGGNYWGRVGQNAYAPELLKATRDPNPEKRAQAIDFLSQGTLRFSGAGEYAGVLVVLVGLWAIAQACRKNGGPYTPAERKWIWFWGIAALLSLLLGFGKYAPLYKLIYHAPLLSNFRNPNKYMHAFHLAFMILFAYGLLALARAYLEPKPASAKGPQPKGWLAGMSLFDRRWTLASFAVLGLCIIGWSIYANARPNLEAYLDYVGFGQLFGHPPMVAAEIAKYSIREVALFILFLGLSIALLTQILRGAFAGRKARTATVLLALLVVVDLGRADLPWIVPFNYVKRYASNGVLDILRQKPYEQRVAFLPLRGNREFTFLRSIYIVEWMQQEFPWYNIQSLDVPQDPRGSSEKATYMGSVGTNFIRLWELTNTRYTFGLGGEFVNYLNRMFDTGKNRFKYHTLFKALTPEDKIVLAETNNTGPFGLIEFTGALPRAKLYSQWQTLTNDQEVLTNLCSPQFDPARTVLLSGAEAARLRPDTSTTNTSPGSVEITSYSPKRVTLQSQADAPTVLLLNDNYDPNWKVWIDGQPAALLRANYLMQAVSLPAGKHTIQFQFQPPLTSLYISLVGLGLAVVLCGLLLLPTRKANPEPMPSAPRGAR